MPKMVRLEQISALLDFIENEPELALGHGSRTNEGRAIAKGRWETCANTLNSVASDCPKKTPAEWRAFYNEYKWKVLKKIKQQKREMNAAGGGSAKKTVLTPLQERLYNILRRDNGDPFAGVRHHPFPKPSRTPPLIEPQVISPQIPPQISQVTVPPCVVKVESCTETVQSLPGSPQSPPGTQQPCPVTPEPHPDAQSNLPPRRRRLRPGRRYPLEDIDHSSRTILARLERMENINAEAIQEQARAINKLAAAIDNIGDKIGNIINLFSSSSSKKQKHCSAASTSSESDNNASL